MAKQANIKKLFVGVIEFILLTEKGNLVGVLLGDREEVLLITIAVHSRNAAVFGNV